jgi:hypothetical protein
MLQRANPEVSKQLVGNARKVIEERFRLLKLIASASSQ